MRRTLLCSILLLVFVACGARTGNDVFELAVKAVNEQSSYSASMTHSSEQSSEDWHVNYANMNQPEHQWRAAGRVVSEKSGKHIVFDSTYISTCLKILSQETDTWYHHEHLGWANVDNPGVLTPPIPMAALRTSPRPDWHVVESNVSEIIISHDPFPNGLTMTLYIDRETRLVNREEMRADEVAADITYDHYGTDDMGVVHKDLSDCKSRN